jgi:hypothetical protein
MPLHLTWSVRFGRRSSLRARSFSRILTVRLPAERMAFITGDSGMRVLLTQTALAAANGS